ncbi:MAG: exopolysaccharide biosynthesis polyprenyl glycosylphosphotransferase [Mariniphaga sp.]|nr:exopolysaccharide biosynthesis polyprenyl glycosylphosphotransferase [Mariniphaga sp.]
MKSFEKELFPIYLLVDLLILNSSLVFFPIFRFDASYLYRMHPHLIYFLHFNACWFMAYFAFPGKTIYLQKGFSNRIIRITRKILIFSLFASATAFLFLPDYYSRQYFAEFFVFYYFGTIISYFLIYKYLKNKRKKGLNTIRTVIISTCEKANLLRRVLESNPILGYKFLGFILTDNELVQNDILGTLPNLEELIRKHRVNMVFSFHNNDNLAYKQQLISNCDKNGVRLRFVMGKNHPFKLQQNFATDAAIELLNPHETPRDFVMARITKRLFDIIFTVFFLVFIFSWLLPIVALIIKVTSKGPVFFRQKRTGFNNKTFKCLKFRTMRPNFLSDIQQASVNDSRITPVGEFLRKSHIDEFPQIINVFLGQMSVIGPRPHMLKHTEQYSELIKRYLIRHYVKPGITGWAQINGYCGETDELWKMEKRVEYDMFYVDNWSLLMDIKIIWRTVFKGKGNQVHSGKSVFVPAELKANQVQDSDRYVPESVMSETV